MVKKCWGSILPSRKAFSAIFVYVTTAGNRLHGAATEGGGGCGCAERGLWFLCIAGVGARLVGWDLTPTGSHPRREGADHLTATSRRHKAAWSASISQLKRPLPTATMAPSPPSLCTGIGRNTLLTHTHWPRGMARPWSRAGHSSELRHRSSRGL